MDDRKKNQITLVKDVIDMLSSLSFDEFADIIDTSKENELVKEKISEIVEKLGERDMLIDDVASVSEVGKHFVDTILRTITMKVVSQFNFTVSKVYNKDIEDLTTSDVNKMSALYIEAAKMEATETHCETTE